MKGICILGATGSIGVSTLELEKMANFYRVRVLEIRNKLTENEKKQAKLREKNTALQNQLVQLKNQQTKVYSEITLAIKCNTTSKSKIQLSYMLTNAGWAPFYDIKSESLTEPITILSKANVYQNTGEDWKNVKLSYGHIMIYGTLLDCTLKIINAFHHQTLYEKSLETLNQSLALVQQSITWKNYRQSI